VRSLRWGWAVAVLATLVLVLSWIYMVSSSVTMRMEIREAPVPTETVYVPLERVVPGPTVTVTAKPKPQPTVTVTAKASRSRERSTVERPGVDAFLRCVIAHESGGDPKAENPTSTASGLFQFIDSSWRAYSRSAGITRYARASQAPASVQWTVARHVVTDYGKYPWKGTNCGGGT
jgi:hypothetical protein